MNLTGAAEMVNTGHEVVRQVGRAVASCSGSRWSTLCFLLLK